VVARTHLADALTNALHNTGSLVTEDCWKRRRQLPVSARNIGVTHTDRNDPNEYVGVLKIRQFDILDDEWGLQALSNRSRSLHGALS
jgi:hypothetical protein